MGKVGSFISVDEDPVAPVSKSGSQAETTTRKPSWVRKKRQRESTCLTDFWSNAGLFFIFVVVGLVVGYILSPSRTQRTALLPGMTSDSAEVADFHGTCLFNQSIVGSLTVDFTNGSISLSHRGKLPIVTRDPIVHSIMILNHGNPFRCLQHQKLLPDEVLVPLAGRMAVTVDKEAMTGTIMNATRIPVPAGVTPLANVIVVAYPEAIRLIVIDCCVIGFLNNQGIDQG